MAKAVRALCAPVAFIDRAEADRRIPPGSSLLIAFAASFVVYTGLVALAA